MIATFVIFLREGVEASMIVSILLAYLDRIGQRHLFRDVFAGVAAALVLAAGGGFAAWFTIRSYDGSRPQAIFETVTYIVAAVILTYMTFWMRSHARSIGGELRDRAEAAIEGRRRLGLALLAFQAVGREGLETAVFTLAIAFATGGKGTLWGAIAGLAGSLAIAVLVFRLGKRLRLGAFFNTVGLLLIVFAAGLVADTVENLQQLGWVKLWHHTMWDTSGALSESSSLGDVVHTFFGYADRPTLLQVTAYLVYLALAVATMARLGRRRPAAAHGPPGRRPGETGSTAHEAGGALRASSQAVPDASRRRRGGLASA